MGNGRVGAAAAALLCVCGAAQGTEHIVSSSGQLSVALASAVSGDIITITPAGSPYTQFPGFSFSNKRLIVRGSTGDPADVILDGSALDRVLTISGAGADDSVIQGLTIRNGMGPGAANSSGAGISINDANVTIENCRIQENHVPAADGNGAGLYATGQSRLTIRGTVFQGNMTENDGDGAGVYLNACPTEFIDCRFLDNVGDPTLNGTASFGGGVFVDNAAYSFYKCEFAGNQSELGAGAAIGSNASATFDACRFDGNTGRYGSGVTLVSATSSMVVRNSLILDNHATVNDAAVRADGPARILNCTLVGNTADGSFIIGSAAADRRVVVVENSIVWGNTANGGLVPVTGTNAPVLRRNLVQSPYAVANGSGFNTVADPLFVSAGDYRVQPGSPAIDAGDTGLYSGSLTDYDDLPRGVDVPAVANTGRSVFGPVIDIGAFEVQVQAASPCYANCDGSTTPPILNVSDFICFQQKYAAGCP